MRQVLLPGSDAREPGRPGRRHGYAKYFLENAKFFTPNANTDSMARSRQDPRNGKTDPVGPDKTFATTRTASARKNPMRPTPNQVRLPGCDKIDLSYPRTLPPRTNPSNPGP